MWCVFCKLIGDITHTHTHTRTPLHTHTHTRTPLHTLTHTHHYTHSHTITHHGTQDEVAWAKQAYLEERETREDAERRAEDAKTQTDALLTEQQVGGHHCGHTVGVCCGCAWVCCGCV